jgi:hypothetical protein
LSWNLKKDKKCTIGIINKERLRLTGLENKNEELKEDPEKGNLLEFHESNS